MIPLKNLTISIWLSISPGVVDIGGSVAMELPIMHDRFGGITIPHLAISSWTLHNHMFHHERAHLRHWDALGPAFPIAYALTLGQEFEDYLNPDGYMWEPPRDMRHNCPIVRIEDNIQFFPCWRF